MFFIRVIRAIRGFSLCAVAWPAIMASTERVGRRMYEIE